MCGIFAAMTRRGLSSEQCDAALKLLEHRGPDGSGIWTSRDGQWTLGHTRLSIIGLNNGTQPMTGPDGAVHLVVNGEFYGYREFASVCERTGIAVASLIAGWAVDGIWHPEHSATPQRRCYGRQP